MSNLGFQEGTSPRNTDNQERSLQKINALLDGGAGLEPPAGSYDTIEVDDLNNPTEIEFSKEGVVVRTVYISNGGKTISLLPPEE
jgi:hypothetical protein